MKQRMHQLRNAKPKNSTTDYTLRERKVHASIKMDSAVDNETNKLFSGTDKRKKKSYLNALTVSPRNKLAFYLWR